MTYTIQGNRSGGGYLLRVTSDDGSTYLVEGTAKNPRSWTCSCNEFFFRSIRTGRGERLCRHIRACMEEKGIEYTPRITPTPQPQGTPEPIHECPQCGSTERVKAGRSNDRQIYQCKPCKRRYTDAEPGFGRNRFSPEIVCGALNMLASGMSYRKTQSHIQWITNKSISHVAIIGWARKYTRTIREYTDALKPVIGNVWSVDEAVINVRKTRHKLKRQGLADWLWTAMDPSTRLVMSSIISSDQRTGTDAAVVLEAAKSMVGRPDYIVTDSINVYDKPARRILPGTAHIRTKSIRDGFTNMSVERWHNEIREKLKSCRGLDTDGSAQVFMDLLRIHHNFIRPHMGLGGHTPAEAAGLTTPDVAKGKYRSLIQMASLNGNRTVARSLGRYNRIVSVTAGEADVRVAPIGWLENENWRAVNGILAKLGFVWLFTAYSRYWSRPYNAPHSGGRSP